jgi:hypothetical protein
MLFVNFPPLRYRDDQVYRVIHPNRHGTPFMGSSRIALLSLSHLCDLSKDMTLSISA